jgi:uncharacterized protein YndB with AHSA1/START domain
MSHPKQTIELTQSIPAPAATVFGAIRNGALFAATGIEPGSFQHDFRVGGKYSLSWQSGGRCTGAYKEIVADRAVSFTWSSDECKSGTNGDTLVRVTLLDRGSSCELRLVHEGLDSGFCHDDHLEGWKSSLEDFAKETLPPKPASAIAPPAPARV